MKTLGYPLFFVAITIQPLLAATQTPAFEQESQKSWTKPVPQNHPWIGKHSAEVRKLQKPISHIDRGLRENAYIFKDSKGKSVMITGRRIEYIDLENFVKNHELVEIKSTPDSKETAKFFKFKNNKTGQNVKIYDWRKPVEKPPEIDPLDLDLMDLDIKPTWLRKRAIV